MPLFFKLIAIIIATGEVEVLQTKMMGQHCLTQVWLYQGRPVWPEGPIDVSLEGKVLACISDIVEFG
jgi:hypothetical protein